MAKTDQLGIKLLIRDKGKQNYDLCTFTTPETSDGRKNAMKSNVLVLV